jgi:hypothetical protein
MSLPSLIAAALAPITPLAQSQSSSGINVTKTRLDFVMLK